jgi:hypothetical protein
VIILSDQGAERRIPPETFGALGRDRSWNAIADNFFQVNRPQLESLAIAASLKATSSGIEMALQPGGIVGAVPLRAPDTHKVAGGIVVRPRFGWAGIGQLLQAIGWTAAPQLLNYPLVPSSAREIPPWVLAGPMIHRFSALLKRLTRGFRVHEEVRQMPRGQIVWQQYLAQQMARGMFHQLPCRFPELGPDQILRAYLRWAIERVRTSLAAYAQVDVIALHLLVITGRLLQELKDISPKIPTHKALAQLSRGTDISPAILREGLEALGWMIDERGLAGSSEMDGLSWRLPMHELFERWIESLIRRWAREFGGLVTSARMGDARFPLHWERPGTGSLTDLAPDIVVQSGETVFIFDAKYKSHFEELDDLRWRELGESLKSEHRHDLHQVLAYASLFDTHRVVALLVYPMFLKTWEALAPRGQSIIRASLPSRSRQVEVGLIGVPLQPPQGAHIDKLTDCWSILKQPL